ncbi:universal stress protein [Calothrix rhizosoleniae]|uniref:universal stress protein n=1 Tax=Calothrix rhizosoleniae TaxID=888997 RepID=UPI000B4A19E5|nr:universal stress protein [Calothrix rhizosoleniae]
MINKILLAVSGLGHAEEMMKMLADVPSLKEAKVSVLHVVPKQNSSDLMTQKWEEGGKILANAIQYLKLDPTNVSSILREGDPKLIVSQVADEIDANLIIMGSRGLKRLQSILKNSVSQYVFQLSSRPMLLVKDDIYVKRINRVMVAIDKSDAAENCLDMALFLLRDIKGSELVLTNVAKNATGKISETSGTSAEDNPIFANAITKTKTQGIQYRCITSSGKPGEEICRLADSNNVDLLLLGSPDRRPSIAKNLVDIDRLIGASLSDYVRVNATCPVMLVRTLA